MLARYVSIYLAYLFLTRWIVVLWFSVFLLLWLMCVCVLFCFVFPLRWGIITFALH